MRETLQSLLINPETGNELSVEEKELVDPLTKEVLIMKRYEKPYEQKIPRANLSKYKK